MVGARETEAEYEGSIGDSAKGSDLIRAIEPIGELLDCVKLILEEAAGIGAEGSLFGN